MTLDARSSYPSTRHYVLKLHRTARPERGQLAGRLEHMSTGRHRDFHSSAELLACLAQDLSGSEPDASGRSSPIT